MSQTNRDRFREAVLKRDGYRCRKCGRGDCKLDAHHITDRHDMPNGGYVIENGITLCDTPDGCHLRAERWHASGHKEVDQGYHPDDLYTLIGSSWETAWEASEALE